MGDANMLYITDFIAKHQGRYVPAVDERNSVLMAGGYAIAGDGPTGIPGTGARGSRRRSSPR